MNKKDVSIGIVSALIGIAVIVYSFFINISVELSEPGPRLFPRIAGVIFIICGIGIAAEAIKDKEEQQEFLGKAGTKKLIAAILVCFVYWAALKLLGFIIVTPFAIMALSWIFSTKKYNAIIGIITGIVSTALLYAIFNLAFHLPLPTGIF